MNNKDNKTEGQISLLDLFDNPDNLDKPFSLQEKNGFVIRLVDVSKKTERGGKDEQVQRAEEKRNKIEQAKREAEERRQQKEKEHIEEVTSMDLPLDWNNAFDLDDRAQGVHFDSIPDALVHCLTTLGKVDIEYISSVTGEDYKTVIRTLKGSIYQNPMTWDECFYKGWETAEEYLSGNLVRKWNAASKANRKYHGHFNANLKAIDKVMPPHVTWKDIYVTLGSPWVPADIIDEFIEHLFGKAPIYVYSVWLRTKHDEKTGIWKIPKKNRYYRNIAVTQTYGTDRINALNILEKTLNMKTVEVTDEVDSDTTKSGKKRVINKTETMAAIERQQKLIKEFQNWVWKDKNRRERLELIFENNFGCVRRRIFDGSFLTFPTMSPDVKLYPYQKNAVARILFTPNTLLAHDVGSGKTYEMIAAGQELKRMGLSEKNMYMVPNNIVGQWESIFLQMYPDAKLLCVEPKSFKKDKRDKVIESIREDEFDGIIIAYSCFDMITPEQFGNLGVTRLFVDEAHNYKNVPIKTQTTKVLGINRSGSKKCKDMLEKVRLVQKNNDGKGVVMATGTPITNSITDAFIMQQYLQSGELAMIDLQSFDNWIGMFAEKKTEFEIDVDTSSYRLATRFSEFHNLPELTSLLSMIADFHSVDESAGIPTHDGYDDTLIEKTSDFADYLKTISKRADDVRNGHINRKDDNMLKITTDGRKAALDLRLVDDQATYTYKSKVAQCAKNVSEIYFNTISNRSTQLVFCDSSTPKTGFNLYDELKKRLIAYGVPAEQIEYIHNAETEKKRSALFSKVRKGDVRILIGSTPKLGLGVNIQDRLIALHHLDVPWRPADMTQREGRILRQGNKNTKVNIYRYITEGSFDAYSWQLLETKQRFISDLLSGSLTDRTGSDVADTVLDYAEVKALAVGNPLVKERVEAQNELTRYLSLQQKAAWSRIKMEKDLLELPGQIESQRKVVRTCSKDVTWYLKWKEENPEEKDTETERRRQFREDLYKAIKENEFKAEETIFANYRGFDIILPANMSGVKPYILLSRCGRYHIDMSESAIGNQMRIDNFLNALPERLKKIKTKLTEMETRETAIHEELAKDENYTDKIEELRQKIELLDKKLGVEE